MVERIFARNVNDAFVCGVELLRLKGEAEHSRAGEVLVMPTPVVTAYQRPAERVLFNPYRDANPWLHLGEALWLLAGRDDATWLNQFVGDFSERFAEHDGTLHGSYGHRWRHHFGYDQLEAVARRLIKEPTTRQAVLAMWDATDIDNVYGANDLEGSWKDRPCNTHVYFRVRNEIQDSEATDGRRFMRQVLDMTVCCRSNDIIWGAYGSNAVHFSILHEYVATCIGLDMGIYYQFSNNFHAYVNVLDKQHTNGIGLVNPYQLVTCRPTQIVTTADRFMEDLDRFLDNYDKGIGGRTYVNQFFSVVAEPFFYAHKVWKAGNRDGAMAIIDHMPQNCDWRWAGVEWFMRRMSKVTAPKTETAHVTSQ
jgi:thymidylate synthase